MNFNKYILLAVLVVIIPIRMSPTTTNRIVETKMITITSPAFGDVLFAGRKYLISWESTIKSNNFAIALYRSNMLLLRIAEGYHGNNEYEWQIPNTLVSGADYSIEIMDMNNGYRCSSHKFRIVGEKDFAKPSSGYRQASSRWKTTTIDGGNVGYHSSIALDGQNRPHISYYDATNENLKYAYFNGTNWVIQTVDAQGNVGDWTSIAVNKKNGYVHISYCHEDNRDLKYALWNGSSWQIETVDGAGDNRGEYTSITLDSKGNPHISYIMGERGDCMYARKTDGTWHIECADDADDVGRYTAIALDQLDLPHISYHDYTNRPFDSRLWCKYARNIGSGWQTEYVESYQISGLYTSIDVDTNNSAHVSYQGSSHCNYAYRTDSGWVIQVVEPSSGDLYVGGTSLLLDNAGIPRLCYYRASSESVHCLKYAWCEDSIWFTEIVDDTNDVGGYCSIALDDEDYLHISYVDWTNQALKYAIAPINDIVVSPSGINFGYVANNQTSEENLVIRNKGFFPRVIERIEIDSEDFSVIGQTFPQTIPALDSIVMSVRFTPSERREYFDTLLIYSDDFHHPIIGVSLNGNSFEQMVIYPNPFIPSRGHNYINFSKIPAGSKIQIFSISGERLCSINTGNSYDIFRWDTRANSGKLLASGYYYYVICDINDRILKKGKFTIIR